METSYFLTFWALQITSWNSCTPAKKIQTKTRKSKINSTPFSILLTRRRFFGILCSGVYTVSRGNFRKIWILNFSVSKFRFRYGILLYNGAAAKRTAMLPFLLAEAEGRYTHRQLLPLSIRWWAFEIEILSKNFFLKEHPHSQRLLSRK